LEAVSLQKTERADGSVIEWPGSVIDSAIIAVPTSVEEMLPPARFANPIALFFYVLQWLLLAPLRAPPDDTAVIRQGTFRSSVDGRWERYEEGTRAANRRGIVGSRTVSFSGYDAKLTPGHFHHIYSPRALDRQRRVAVHPSQDV